MATQKLGTRGAGSAVVAGLAFAAGSLALFALQQRKFNETRLRIEQQRAHFHLLDEAIQDPELAAVMSTVDLSAAPPEKRPTLRRQYIFANAWYTNILQLYRSGTITWEELYGHLRVVCQSGVFRDYWDATRHHRESLPYSSDEARVGRMVDRLIQELDDADTDEWWVVGEPPTE
ncbi:DUF6082 family protein [Streptomyces sp. NPDC001848]|uniref:DUF6082 family protein n=1 Tax=Streptomyces sp. NPDC001848 TaxID=3364618 RepID=UPI0036C0EEBB